ncbi:alpha-amylase family glycosyl hydrolase [Rhodococcus jostii]|uniref:Alpha-amylase family glycosyl hydrolase n=1 Tax=Rhodococcus jostii TaxID=132919 RepID=A0ABU4CN10_RHOJO|nr:alpha-amylase family glycosyl hydrolase [Rhodococcus jostii]MDV6284956.1 alpha-amylase family glycosyl hydrolase [Rhodococcus jostii]
MTMIETIPSSSRERRVGWLDDAVIYEIYPQSFADSNGDGIGDLRGVIDHLDHLVWLGVNTIWFNPCFASPFRDAGYDVADFEQIAPRYGSNDDLIALCAAAEARGIRVLLDLVAGHTSIAHRWFVEESGQAMAAGGGPVDGDRYIWRAAPADGSDPGEPWVAPTGQRPGYYYKNFYDEQPALNFGYARTDPDEPWRQGVDAAGPQANRAALRQIMAFWLDRGVAGFRVDMAYSLVKDDPDREATAALWRDLFSWLRQDYPDAVLLPESDMEAPVNVGVRSGFDGDFFLVNQAAHSALFNNGGAGSLWWLPEHKHCFFDADGSDGAGSLGKFLALWNEHLATNGPDRRVVLGTADHDYSRLASGNRGIEQLPAAYTFLLTWGSVPSIYYGDEIGMRYLPGLPDVEGSICYPGYNRAGCRTPMQWDDALPNAGFSEAADEAIYLPQDSDPYRPTVVAQLADSGSLLHTVRRLLSLRAATPALGVGSDQQVLVADYPFAYIRGGSHLVVVNPRRDPAEALVPELGGRAVERIEGAGVDIEGTRISAAGFGWAVFSLS